MNSLSNNDKKHLDNMSLKYRGRDIYSFDLAASKVVSNIKRENLIELLVGIFEILKENSSHRNYVTHEDCKHLCSNYRDFQNLLYQMGFLDKVVHGKYILTNEGMKVAEGENFCEYLPKALLSIVKSKKEDDRHALLLLWIYYQASLNGQPELAHFQKKNEETSYPKIRYQVGKTMMRLLSNCFDNDMMKINVFFEEWKQLLN